MLFKNPKNYSKLFQMYNLLCEIDNFLLFKKCFKYDIVRENKCYCQIFREKKNYECDNYLNIHETTDTDV